MLQWVTHGLFPHVQLSCQQEGTTAASRTVANYVQNRLKEQQLKEAEDSAVALNKGLESADRATESARHAKQRMASEVARMQRLVQELEQSKR